MSIQRALAVLLVLAAPNAAFAQAGYADTSLGGGYVVIPPGNLSTNWIGCQSTGKIVIVGRLNVTVPGTSDITIGAERICTDGTFDTTFGQNGLFSFATPYNPFGAIAAAVQTDDCIVTLSSEFEIVRINANGTLDASFGSGGMVDMWGTYKRNWNAGSVAIQPDGKIVVAGFSSAQTGHSTTGWDLTILRLNVNGSLDPTFGNFGHGSTPGFIVDAVTGNQQFNRRCLAIQPDGKLVVVCWGTDSPSFVARYLSTGALDTTFGVGGRRTFSITGNDVPTGLALMGDGRIVVGGHGQNGTTAFVVRFSAGGVLDTSFGAGGSTTRNFGAGTGPAYCGIALQADGSVLVPVSLPDGGSDVNGPTVDMAVWRLTPSGFSDVAFGPTADGVSQLLGTLNVNDPARNITIDLLGRIIVAGTVAGSGPALGAIHQ